LNFRAHDGKHTKDRVFLRADRQFHPLLHGFPEWEGNRQGLLSFSGEFDDFTPLIFAIDEYDEPVTFQHFQIAIAKMLKP
jgi:hypothetical protein